MFIKGKPVDPITVAEALKASGNLEGVGGKPYLHTLVSGVPTAAHALHYARIIERNSSLRALIKAATEIAQIGYDAPEDINWVLDKAETLIFNVAKKRISEKFIHIKDLAKETWEHIEKLYEGKSEVIGVPSGFKELDELTSGFQKSDLIIIAGRPSMGKTSLALSIARNVAVDNGIPVAIFSLEMSKSQLSQRMLCSEAKVDLTLLRSGKNLGEKEWIRMSTALGELSEAPIYVDDTPSITVMELRAKARRLAKGVDNLGLIIIDYLQLMHSNSRSENRQQEVSEISRALKVLGRELDIPVIAISQLSRAIEQRQDKRPQLSDLRESGAIEQDADLVIFIYRQRDENKDDDYNYEKAGEVEIKIAKHRNGPIGNFKLIFLEKYAKFEHYSARNY